MKQKQQASPEVIIDHSNIDVDQSIDTLQAMVIGSKRSIHKYSPEQSSKHTRRIKFTA